MKLVLGIKQTNVCMLIFDNQGRSITFDVSTVLGDTLEDNENGLFEMVRQHNGDITYFKDVHLLLSRMLSKGKLNRDVIEEQMANSFATFPHRKGGSYLYNCNSLDCVVLSILHFLELEGYKIAYCKHCGRVFATKNLKIVYCNRNSTFFGYEQYSCRDAVKRINDVLEKRRKIIYDWFWYKNNSADAASLGYDRYNAVQNFMNECDVYKKAIKQAASVANFKAYSDYLNSEYFPKKYDRFGKDKKEG